MSAVVESAGAGNSPQALSVATEASVPDEAEVEVVAPDCAGFDDAESDAAAPVLRGVASARTESASAGAWAKEGTVNVPTIATTVAEWLKTFAARDQPQQRESRRVTMFLAGLIHRPKSEETHRGPDHFRKALIGSSVPLSRPCIP